MEVRPVAAWACKVERIWVSRGVHTSAAGGAVGGAGAGACGADGGGGGGGGAAVFVFLFLLG